MRQRRSTDLKLPVRRYGLKAELQTPASGNNPFVVRPSGLKYRDVSPLTKPSTLGGPASLKLAREDRRRPAGPQRWSAAGLRRTAGAGSAGWITRPTKQVFALALALCIAVAAHAARQPNVVVVLTDDQGWGDLSINGNTAIGEPDVCGATIELIANGTNPTRQKFTLPETNWASVAGGKRFIYKDPDNEHSPVVQMVLAQQSRRRFSIMAFARGAPSSPVPLEMVPPNEGTDAWMIVQIGAGDRYCAHYSSDATVKNRGDRLFEVKRSEVESPCPPL